MLTSDFFIHAAQTSVHGVQSRGIYSVVTDGKQPLDETTTSQVECGKGKTPDGTNVTWPYHHVFISERGTRRRIVV